MRRRGAGQRLGDLEIGDVLRALPLLRIDPAVLDSLQTWADDELRSLNGQIEFVLRRVLQQEGRMKDRKDNDSGAS